jgi:hypothetical protein
VLILLHETSWGIVTERISISGGSKKVSPNQITLTTHLSLHSASQPVFPSFTEHSKLEEVAKWRSLATVNLPLSHSSEIINREFEVCPQDQLDSWTKLAFSAELKRPRADWGEELDWSIHVPILYLCGESNQWTPSDALAWRHEQSPPKAWRWDSSENDLHPEWFTLDSLHRKGVTSLPSSIDIVWNSWIFFSNQPCVDPAFKTSWVVCFQSVDQQHVILASTYRRNHFLAT